MPTRNSSTIALLSIQPQYVKAIMSGNKKVEFRKRAFKKGVDIVLVYETAPRQEIVGYFEIEKIKVSTPKDIWNIYTNISGISKDDFFDYYNNSDIAVGILIKKFIPFENPIQPAEYKITPPQSYCYISTDLFDMLLKKNNLPKYFKKERLP